VDDYQDLYSEKKPNGMYDAAAAPNDTKAKIRRQDITDTTVKILGSPRYNKEWIDVLSNISPDVECISGLSPQGQNDESKTCIVFFLRHRNYWINKKATEATIRIIAQLPATKLVLAEHPRNTLFKRNTFNDLSNIIHLTDKYPSASLFKAGDIFLDMGSSISFEAIVRDQPVLSMDYLHANITTIGHYLNSAKMESIDELYETLAQILTEKQARTYSLEERKTFVDNMIDNSPGMNVLSRYITFLTDWLESTDPSDARINAIKNH
jgi:hypothetical protein